MALFDVAQAVTIHMLGPCRPNSIEMRPLAMLLISIGIVNGEVREGPLVNRIVNLILECFQSADSAADEDAETVSLFQVGHINPAVLERHFRRCHRELRKSIGAADILWVFEE